MNSILKTLFALILILIAGAKNSSAQNNSAAFAAADTSEFSVNNIGGWQLFNSYVELQNGDSVQLELIIQHNNGINWSQEQYIGKIKPISLLPSQERTASFSLITDQYLIRIDNEGKCFLKLFSGSAPSDNPAVIPLKVIYKK